MIKPLVFEMKIELAAPPAKLWPFLVDWENLGSWMKEGRRFKVTSRAREGVGVTAEADIRIAGVTTHDLIRVTQWQPRRLLEIQHLGWVKGNGRMTIAETGPGSALFWTETLIPPLGLVGSFGLKVLRPLIHRVFRRDLRLLKALVEA
ncbi:MAG: SRPBCC family protein [Actinobacteria bacterium]|nr:SRPBCC family protein [Actinomycetota bacterium]